jgi:nucleotide-binding universal stress UspA family protein
MSEKTKSNIPLVKSVLHPTDFSAASDRAFAHALGISLLRQTRFTILHIGPEKERNIEWSKFPPVRKTLERWGLLQGDSHESAVADELNVRVTKLAIRGRNPVNETLKFLEKNPHDLVVLATEGRDGVARWLDPCDAEAMARRSNTMTLFVPAESDKGLISLSDGETHVNNILVPLDRKPDFRTAAEFARRVAEAMGEDEVTITLMHVGDEMPELGDLEDGPGWRWRHELRNGDPIEEMLAAAEELSADLIVMATDGRNGMLDVVRGSHTEQVVRRCQCPLLAVPEDYLPST